jgi:hypothetical protein
MVHDGVRWLGVLRFDMRHSHSLHSLASRYPWTPFLVVRVCTFPTSLFRIPGEDRDTHMKDYFICFLVDD